jgi:hypothetical protein
MASRREFRRTAVSSINLGALVLTRKMTLFDAKNNAEITRHPASLDLVDSIESLITW